MLNKVIKTINSNRKPINENITGLILSGGQSSRMGKNKATLIHNNKILLEHMLSLLEQLSLKNIFISGQPLENTSINSDQFIVDTLNNKGPLGGIYSVINFLIEKEIKSKYLLIIPVDMPLLSVKLLKELISSIDHSECVFFENYNLPLLIKTDENLLSVLNKLLLTVENQPKSSYSIKSFICEITSKSLKPANFDNDFMNINTPEDFKRLNLIKE